MTDIDFHWDIGSTNSYFAFRLLPAIAARHGARIVPKPFNLGHVFRRANYALMEEPREKLRHRGVDLRRWARRYDLPFRVPDAFPIKTSRALRAALAMRRFGAEWAFMDALFSAYWERNDGSIADWPGLTPLIAACDVDPAAARAVADSPEVQAELAAETDAALARGVFGAPTMFVGDEMYWGKDRMDFLEEELARVGAG